MKRNEMTQNGTTIAIAHTATGGGVVATTAGWITSELLLGICGIVIAACGVGVAWYYRHKDDKRKEYVHGLMLKWYKHHNKNDTIPRF